jgi:hypothetical protein
MMQLCEISPVCIMLLLSVTSQTATVCNSIPTVSYIDFNGCSLITGCTFDKNRKVFRGCLHGKECVMMELVHLLFCCSPRSLFLLNLNMKSTLTLYTRGLWNCATVSEKYCMVRVQYIYLGYKNRGTDIISWSKG